MSWQRYENIVELHFKIKSKQIRHPMLLVKSIYEINKYIQIQRETGVSIGFVPTMGALHAGHLSLIKNSKTHCDRTVCSIFVNPTQFNDPADFQQYPITIEADIRLLEQAGCDVLFLPSVEVIYPSDYVKKQYQLGSLETLLEGKYRPGHFQGVCQVVDRLLSIVMPDELFLGRKDYQQCMVITELIRQTGLPVTTTIVPTMRESSGLAMSSRNLRLSEHDRDKATAIYNSLQWIKANLKQGDVTDLTTRAADQLLKAGFSKIDYISIADAHSLEEVNNWDGQQPLVALVAAFLSGIRLIDNISLTKD